MFEELAESPIPAINPFAENIPYKPSGDEEEEQISAIRGSAETA